MNVYVLIRTILHCLLFLVNLFDLTVASWIVAISRKQGHKTTAGSVLVILGSIFYAFITISIWSETCIPRSKLSKNRTEAIMLPILFLFQIIGAIVATADATKGTCRDYSSCVALLILSWMSAFTLLIYYLITMVVTFYHFALNEEIWDESPLTYDWFPMLPSKPPKDSSANPPRGNSRGSSIETAPIEPSHPSLNSQPQPQRSSWMPPPLNFDNELPDRTVNMVPYQAPAPSNQISQHFGDIPFQAAPPLDDDEDASRFSFSIPPWARKLKPVKRGKELPFPVAVKTSSLRSPIRNQDPRSNYNIDAPVPPTYFVE